MSLRLRSLIALGLLAGFYLLGALVVLGLAAVPWAQQKYALGLDVWGGLCGIAALWVAWALLPRFQSSTPAEGQLNPDEFPALFELVRGIAVRTGQRPPEKLFLLPDVNAFAGTESRLFGLRRVPIVGIGLPLLSFLSREELTSVIAHEFGHHRGGDTRLGPLLYHTRSAIGRAVQHLDGSRFLLHLPFVSYGKLFLRITRGIGRAQELAADRLAREIVGAEPCATAVEKVERLAPAWDAYWYGEYVPALSRGVAPPLFDGFIEFVDRPELRPKLSELLERQRKVPPSPYDTHPPLDERLRAFGFTAPPEAPLRESLELLGDCDKAEQAALRLVLVAGAEVRRLSWQKVGEEVWLRDWQEEVQQYGGTLLTWRASELPAILNDADRWYHTLRRGPNLLSRRAQAQWLRGFIGRWLGVALNQQGFDLVARPGAPLVLRRGDLDLDLDKLIAHLADGQTAAGAWRERCTEWGLS